MGHVTHGGHGASVQMRGVLQKGRHGHTESRAWRGAGARASATHYQGSQAHGTAPLSASDASSVKLGYTSFPPGYDNDKL